MSASAGDPAVGRSSSKKLSTRQQLAGSGSTGGGRPPAVAGHSTAGGALHGGVHPAESHQAGSVLKHIMHVQLLDLGPSGTAATSTVAATASALLQAVCIRSSEGRRRIMNELVATLNGQYISGGKASEVQQVPVGTASLPYVQRPGIPSPVEVGAHTAC